MPQKTSRLKRVRRRLVLEFLPFPTLETERLVLRRITENDIEALYFLRADEEMMRFIDRDRVAGPDEMLPFLRMIDTCVEDGSALTWGVALKADPSKMIGTIGFWRIVREHFRAEIGCALHRDYWGSGLMTEAMKAALDFGFKNIRLHSVEANINPENSAAAALVERTGFLKEGHFKENVFFQGEFLSTAVYTTWAP